MYQASALATEAGGSPVRPKVGRKARPLEAQPATSTTHTANKTIPKQEFTFMRTLCPFCASRTLTNPVFHRQFPTSLASMFY